MSSRWNPTVTPNPVYGGFHFAVAVSNSGDTEASAGAWPSGTLVASSDLDRQPTAAIAKSRVARALCMNRDSREWTRGS